MNYEKVPLATREGMSGATMMLTFHLSNQALQMVSNQFNIS
jgi:hypothetical protein